MDRITEILNLLTGIKKDVEELKQKELENSIEEISLLKASRLLGCGSERLMRYINDGILPARKIVWNGGKVVYKVRVRAIRELQKRLTETPAGINPESVDLSLIVKNFHQNKKPVRQNGL